MASNTSYGEIVHRKEALIKFLQGFQPTKLPLEPMPGEIRQVVEDIDCLWTNIDPFILAIAEHVETMTGRKIDKQWKVDQLRGALEGNLTHEIESIAGAVNDDLVAAVA
jgi:hypothetical protein